MTSNLIVQHTVDQAIEDGVLIEPIATTPPETPGFALGRLVITANAHARLAAEAIAAALARHAQGDWGDLCCEDVIQNQSALKHGGRLMSAYGDGATFWIITEADRSVTTILLPEDY